MEDPLFDNPTVGQSLRALLFLSSITLIPTALGYLAAPWLLRIF